MQLTCNLLFEGLWGSGDRRRRNSYARAFVGICRRKIMMFLFTDVPSGFPSSLINIRGRVAARQIAPNEKRMRPTETLFVSLIALLGRDSSHIPELCGKVSQFPRSESKSYFKKRLDFQ